MRNIDKVQCDVMESLKDCGSEPEEVVNIMLSIAYSISEEIVQSKQRRYANMTAAKYLREKVTELDKIRKEGV